MDAFGIRDTIIADYESFVRSFVDIRDTRVLERVTEDLSEGLLWPEPWLALNPSFESGGTIAELVDSELLHPDCTGIFRHRTDENQVGTDFRLHRHQRDAVEIAARGESYVLTTGTGSGKSLAYIVPIVDRVLRQGSGKGVQAIVVYPMNALANSQIGELEKFLGKTAPKVTFQRYTGQESKSKREEILASPPDILLTNYVMLELLLTRPEERKRLIQSAKSLRFLALDELHTYRGRQGADVAMLIRRLRGAVGVGDQLQCVGTSATLAGPGTPSAQRAEVALLASRIFGTQFSPNNVVGETLRRATKGSAPIADLTARVASSAPAERGALETDPVAVWIEEQFGLRTDVEGRLTRQSPKKLADVAATLAELTGRPVEACETTLKETLLAGASAKDADRRSLFAFKLHQFIGKGDTVYVTLEDPDTRYITTKYQLTAPIGEGGRPLYPLSFCRECGQEYLAVTRDDGNNRVVPRVQPSFTSEDNPSTAVLLLTQLPWPDKHDKALLNLVPDDWFSGDADDEDASLDKDRVKSLPTAVQVDQFGSLGIGLHAALFARLDFCPSCKTTYEVARASEFARLASLGTEGRASAITVLSQSVVQALRNEPDVPDEARKFLAFSDNRQDASLQAGNFNDFVLVGIVRAALLRAAQDAFRNDPDEPLTDDELGKALIKALNLDVREYAVNPYADAAARRNTDRALRRSMLYRVYADLQRGWKITMPNLEQTGQLVIDYLDVAACAAKQELWESDEVQADPILLHAATAEREQIMRVLLDEMRRNLCINTDYLTEDEYDTIKNSSQQWLKAPWPLADDRGVYAATCFPFSRPKGRKDHGNLYLSGLSSYGKWLRKPRRFGHLKDHKIRHTDATALIEQIMKAMTQFGLLTAVEENKTTGFRIQSSMMAWLPGDGIKRAPDPLRGNSSVGRVNPYFADFYANAARSLAGLEAREHTAQVPSDVREQRETAFGDAHLPVLYCSPTMELGVDIKDLAVVGMRNVPPTPANYAQRSGRAGRSGQPAVVVTYCATGNAHDAFYFRRSDDMVAGAVAPPKLELGNQDLVRAHAHAIWLVEIDLDLKASMIDLIDLEQPGEPWFPDVAARINDLNGAQRAIVAINKVLRATPEVTNAPWWTDDWVADTVKHAPANMDRSLERWRGLRNDAQRELARAAETLAIDTATKPVKDKARARQYEARAMLDLLVGNSDERNQSDFYTYRYFASEGFLPGYSFPRLPLAAFIPGSRKTRNGEGDFLQRPRFLAISEFGPGAFIYHEGARYEVERVSIPASDDGTGVHLLESRRCLACGYMNEGNGETGATVCEQCQSGQLETIPSLMKLLSVKTRRRDRISADEDERQRAGHEIVTTMRFEPYGERHSQMTSQVLAADGTELATLTYGDTALIRRMNVGLRRRKNKMQRGYLLNPVSGKWERNPGEHDASVGDGSASVVGSETVVAQQFPRVVPYVEDHRNALVMRFPNLPDAHSRMAVLYALKRGIEAVFQIESNELAAEPLPDRTGDNAWNVLLLFESAEGGAGVLRRLAIEDGAFQKVAAAALDILHFDSAGIDLGLPAHAKPGTETCAKACYDCLLSYSNQWDHQNLDRFDARGALLAFTAAAVAVGGAGVETRAEQLARLRVPSNSLEDALLKLVEDSGYWLPDEAQKLIDDVGGVRPDFAYRRKDGDVAIFVDGPVHDHAHIQLKDAKARAKLENHGWLVVRFPSDKSLWPTIFAEYPTVFGRGRAN